MSRREYLRDPNYRRGVVEVNARMLQGCLGDLPADAVAEILAAAQLPGFSAEQVERGPGHLHCGLWQTRLPGGSRIEAIDEVGASLFSVWIPAATQARPFRSGATGDEPGSDRIGVYMTVLFEDLTARRPDTGAPLGTVEVPAQPRSVAGFPVAKQGGPLALLGEARDGRTRAASRRRAAREAQETCHRPTLRVERGTAPRSVVRRRGEPGPHTTTPRGA